MPKRKFDKEFKCNAVRLVKEQGISIVQASHDLGIGKSTLQRWVKEIKKHGIAAAFPGEGHLHKEEDEKLRKLQRENEVLRRERDILKKALAIFSRAQN